MVKGQRVLRDRCVYAWLDPFGGGTAAPPITLTLPQACSPNDVEAAVGVAGLWIGADALGRLAFASRSQLPPRLTRCALDTPTPDR